MKLAFLIFTVSLFFLNYFICDFFYPENDYASVRMWNYINVSIIHTMFFLCLINIKLVAENMHAVYRFVLAIGIGFTASDLVDRWCFHITSFVWSDLAMILIVLIIEYKNNLYSYVRQRRRSVKE